MGNELSKSLGAAAQKSMPLFDPESLTLITDKKHPLYDERIEWPVQEAMVRSVMIHGVIEPVIVRKNGLKKDGSPIVEVVDGRQRVKAALEANKRLKAEGSNPIRVPAVSRSGEDVALMGVMITANEIRRGDEIVVKAKKAQRLIDNGATEEDAADQFGVDVATIKNWLVLGDCCADVIKAISSGELAVDVARKMAKLSREDQKELLEKMRKKGATKGRKAGKAVADATGKPSTALMGKKPIKWMLHNLKGSHKESDSALEKSKFEFGIMILEHILGTRDQPFENPRNGAIVVADDSGDTESGKEAEEPEEKTEEEDDTMTREEIIANAPRATKKKKGRSKAA